jgi:hypothetical protein
MTENCLFAGWLRSFTVLVAVAGGLGLSGCGGGSGAPNNPFTPLLTVLPGTAVTYSGVPTTLTISGGTGPYRAFSSNSTVLPVVQSVPGKTVVLLATNVNDDTEVTITVQDAALPPSNAQVPVTVTVRAAPLLNSLTITPNLEDCGTGAICSGQNGTATVTVLGPQGAQLAGRAVRFDVVGTAYAIATNDPAQPFVSSRTVSSDASGAASVIVKANLNVATQFVQMTATDLTSGQQLTGNFVIQQVTDGSKILTVVPGAAKITGVYKGECSAGFRTDYYIYGGTPPYRVTSSFPAAATLVNPVVNVNGGFFEAITNGYCVDPMTFSILDATGRQTTATLSNVEGENERTTVAPPALAGSPEIYTDTACTGKTFSFVISGGTTPYNVSASRGTVTPQLVPGAGGKTSVSGLTTGGGVTSVLFLDSSSPQKSATATINCDNPVVTPPVVPALTVTPASYTSTACTGTPFSFAVSGGTPPYNVVPTAGTAAPTTIGSSGGVATVTGLTTGSGLASVLFLDQSVPQKSVAVSITCNAAP